MVAEQYEAESRALLVLSAKNEFDAGTIWEFRRVVAMLSASRMTGLSCGGPSSGLYLQDYESRVASCRYGVGSIDRWRKHF
jgi:hypothetical protein